MCFFFFFFFLRKVNILRPKGYFIKGDLSDMISGISFPFY